ncbi:MAG: Clp protease N-terminal domain-containing protein, partial [Pygmaiobacter sp.]
MQGLLYFRNLSEKANRCCVAAIDLAGQMGHLYVGTEHLLAGILTEGTSRAAVLLCERGMSGRIYLDYLRLQVGKGIAVRLSPADFTGNVVRILEAAASKSEMQGEPKARPEHLLAAMLRAENSTALRHITQFGIDCEVLLSACESGYSSAMGLGGYARVQQSTQ